MRHWITWVGLLMLVLAGCRGGSSLGNHSSDELDGEQVTLHVRGLSCPLCAHNLDKSLEGLAGVSRASIDLGSGRVIVELSGETRPSAAELARVVANSGFTLVRIE